jgi:hypothetical protein
MIEFNKDYQEFYDQCLAELQARQDYTECYLPILERYVLVTMKAAITGAEIVDEEVVIDHTNKAKATNKASSPKLRMFFELNNQANILATQLKLSPASAPPASAKKKKGKGFDLNMKVA